MIFGKTREGKYPVVSLSLISSLKELFFLTNTVHGFDFTANEMFPVMHYNSKVGSSLAGRGRQGCGVTCDR